MRQDIWQKPSLSSFQQKRREAKSRVRVSEKTASPGYESEPFFQKSRLQGASGPCAPFTTGFLDTLSVPACFVRGMSGNNSFKPIEFEPPSVRKWYSKQAGTLNVSKNPLLAEIRH
jgi:hypothetical protein